MEQFGRLMTGIVTPFHDDFSINYAVVSQLAELVLSSGSDTIIVASSTGEQTSLTEGEKFDLFRAAVDAASNRGLVVAATGTADLQETIRITQSAEAAGVDGALVLAPYCCRPPQRALTEYFRAIAESTNLPILLYDIPFRTATSIAPETVVELSVIDNIVGIKDASADFNNMLRLLTEVPEGFQVYSGDEPSMLAHLAMGATGVIGVASHLVGPQMRQIVDLVKSADLVAARAIHRRLLPLFRGLYETTNPILIKAALRMHGIQVGPPRPPLLPADASEISELEALLQTVGSFENRAGT